MKLVVHRQSESRVYFAAQLTRPFGKWQIGDWILSRNGNLNFNTALKEPIIENGLAIKKDEFDKYFEAIAE